MTGYNPNFFTDHKLPLPQLTDAHKKDRASLKDNANNFELTYMHYSLVLNKKRKFAFFAATNIDGKTWQGSIKDRNDFGYDDRVLSSYQTGNELYDFYQSKTEPDFDKGHIAKFQDTQWGDETTIKKAADDTMKFANCVPQHPPLNRGA